MSFKVTIIVEYSFSNNHSTEAKEYNSKSLIMVHSR